MPAQINPARFFGELACHVLWVSNDDGGCTRRLTAGLRVGVSATRVSIAVGGRARAAMRSIARRALWTEIRI